MERKTGRKTAVLIGSPIKTALFNSYSYLLKMANKEYSSRLNEFWHSLAATFSVVPVLMVIGFSVTYFIGTFRPDYIRK